MCMQCKTSEEGRELCSCGGGPSWPTASRGSLESEAVSRQVVAQLMALAPRLGWGTSNPVELGRLAAEYAAARLSDRTRAAMELVERALLVELACVSGRVEVLRGADLAQLMPSAASAVRPDWSIWGSFRIVGALLSSLAELALTSTPSLARLSRFEVGAGVLTLDLQGSSALLLVAHPEFGNLDRIEKGRSNAASVLRVHTVRRCLAILGAEVEYHRDRSASPGISLRIPVCESDVCDGDAETP